MSTRPSRSVVGSANRAFIDLAHTSRAFVVDATIARAITRFAMIERTSDTTTTDARVVELEALLATERASFTQRIAALEAERDKLLRSYERVRYELELLKRRIFVAKAERVDTQQLELEFAAKMRELEIAAGTLGLSAKDDDGETTAPKSKPKPPGRRSLRDTALRVETIRLADPHFEELVAEGKATVHGVEETCRVAHKRGGPFVLVTQRVKYKTEATDGSTAVVTTPTPPELISRCIAAPSILAHSIIDKVGFGLPLFRQEQRFAAEGLPIDRGSLSRWHEQLGATFGASVVHAMRDHAMRTAFCIATDATGIAVQPIRTHEKQRKACKRGHYLVQIADRDYVFFEYLERETSAAIGELFKGFGGYVQADAKSVFDALFEPPDRRDDGDENLRHEVGCWSHARRKYWEATAAKSEVAREGLRRIGRIFELDARWRGKPPTEIKKLRDAHLRPHVDAFFAWAAVEHDKVRAERGLLASALGYSVRQRHALVRFLDDGRLKLDNNRSERALRAVAVGRKNWLFTGSDDHAQSTAHLFTMVATARLHGLDVEQYLRDLIYVLPYWPRERFLELAPPFWRATRERLDAVQLDSETLPLTVPPPITTDATEQQTSR